MFPRRTRSLVGVRQGPVSLNRRAAYAAPRHCTSSVEQANGHVSTLDAPPTMKRAAAEFATESYWKDEGWGEISAGHGWMEKNLGLQGPTASAACRHRRQPRRDGSRLALVVADEATGQAPKRSSQAASRSASKSTSRIPPIQATERQRETAM